MNDEKPVNGHTLAGDKLTEALEHDEARKGVPAADRVWGASDVKEANRAPCPVCLVHENAWCAGSGGSTDSSGEWVASSAHAARLQLARADVSLRVERKLEELRQALPIGEALKAAEHQWPAAVAYTDLVVRQALAEAVCRVARELNVETVWLMDLAGKVAQQQRLKVVPPPIPPAAPAVESIDERVAKLESGMKFLGDQLSAMLKTLAPLTNRKPSADEMKPPGGG